MFDPSEEFISMAIEKFRAKEKTKLRLLLTEKCNRKCKGCCNKDWDLQSLPICTNYNNYDELILTGGEPMLIPLTVSKVIDEIRKQTSCPIYLYTAKTDMPETLLEILFKLDGLTVTIHTQKDLLSFASFEHYLNECWVSRSVLQKSLRLNIFKDIENYFSFVSWKIKDNIVWKKDCPLPEDEIFMRYQ
jgi:organic radical activating enzyme